MGNSTYPTDLTGLRFGKLQVIGAGPHLAYKGKRQFRFTCKCDCGTEAIVARCNLLATAKSPTRSCGCLQKTTRLLPGDLGSFNQFFNRYLSNAATRNLAFSLSEQQFRELTEQSCFYCGASPQPYFARNRKHIEVTPYVCNGLDRFDNKVGYELENCVPCCAACNYMKRGLSADTFLSHVQAVAKYQENQ